MEMFVAVDRYRRIAKQPSYQSLFAEVDLTTAAEEVHNGYFSIDKKKVGSKSVEVFKDMLKPEAIPA